jgi:hypothetical protein
MRSLDVGSSMSRTADVLVRGDPCFISCGVMASDPYSRRKGVNPVARHLVVFKAQTSSGSWSAHLPFLSSRSLCALDNAVGLRVIYRGKGKLGADGEAEVPEVLVVKLFAIVDYELGQDSESANNVLLEELLGSLRHYCGYCPGLNPLGKIFDGDEGELEVPLRHR